MPSVVVVAAVAVQELNAAVVAAVAVPVLSAVVVAVAVPVPNAVVAAVAVLVPSSREEELHAAAVAVGLVPHVAELHIAAAQLVGVVCTAPVQAPAVADLAAMAGTADLAALVGTADLASMVGLAAMVGTVDHLVSSAAGQRTVATAGHRQTAGWAVAAADPVAVACTDLVVVACTGLAVEGCAVLAVVACAGLAVVACVDLAVVACADLVEGCADLAAAAPHAGVGLEASERIAVEADLAPFVVEAHAVHPAKADFAAVQLVLEVAEGAGCALVADERLPSEPDTDRALEVAGHQQHATAVAAVLLLVEPSEAVEKYSAVARGERHHRHGQSTSHHLRHLECDLRQVLCVVHHLACCHSVRSRPAWRVSVFSIHHQRQSAISVSSSVDWHCSCHSSSSSRR